MSTTPFDIAAYFTANGGVVGDMSGTPAQRVTNATVLQNAINLADSNGQAMEFFPTARIEISNTAGIIIPASQRGLVWRGSSGPNSGIVQFHANAPIVIIGDITGTATLGGQASVEGLYMSYGVSQTGNTGALALQMGAWASSRFANIKVDKFGPAGTFPAYVCYTEVHASFSNTYADFDLQGGQQSIARLNQNGGTSGSVYTNIYCSAGNLNAPAALTDYAFGWSNNGIGNCIFEQLNVEAVATNRLLNVPNCRGTVFNDVHLETITLTGVDPLVWACASSGLTIDGCTLDFILTTAGGASGYGRFIGTFGSDSVVMSNIALLNQSSDSGAVDLPFYMVDAIITPDTPANVTLRGLRLNDDTGQGLSTHVGLDLNMPLGDFGPVQTVADYRFGYNLSRSYGVVRTVSDNYTHYGSDIDATLLAPASLSGTKTITLSNKNKSSGQGSTTKPMSGNTVRIRRQSGTFANNLIVVNGGSGGGTLWTNNSAAAENQFTFDGTNWSLSL
jgi:hypothetical protein